MLSSLFFLWAFTSYSKATQKINVTGWRKLGLTTFCVIMSMLCKEQGITVIGVCFVYEVFVVQKISLRSFNALSRSWASCRANGGFGDAVRRMVTLTVVTGILLYIRYKIMGSQLPVFTKFDNPAAAASFPTRQLTFNYLVAVNLWLLILPHELCCDWTMQTIPLVETWTDPRNLSTLTTYAATILMIVYACGTRNRNHSIVILMGLSLMILPFLPASNLFFSVGFVVAERVLYMPSMGFCMLVAYGYQKLSEKINKKVIHACLVLLIVIHGTKTYARNWDWENEYTIFTSGLRVTQNNAKLYNNVGHVLETEGKYMEALEYFKKAASIQEDDIGAHINVGRTYTHLKMLDEAEKAYVKALALLPKPRPGEVYEARIAPNHLSVFVNLANLISRNASRLEEADLLYRQAISMRADYIQAYINRGDILMRLNRSKEAQQVYEMALVHDPRNPDIYYNLGVVFLQRGDGVKALAYFDKALEYEEEHEPALFNSAILLQELGQKGMRELAKHRLLILHRKNSTNERVHFNLGMICMDDGEAVCAEEWFRSTIELKSNSRAALFNLGLLLTDQMRPLEATPFLNHLVNIYPDHIKGLILLGDIYTNSVKHLDNAEACYRQILHLEPKNIQSLHNLCVVLVQKGKLNAGARCLRKTVLLAPREAYVQKHLSIVLQRLAKKDIDKPKQKYEMKQFLKEYDPTFDNVAIHENFRENDGFVTTPEEFRTPSIEQLDSFLVNNKHSLKADPDDTSSGVVSTRGGW